MSNSRGTGNVENEAKSEAKRRFPARNGAKAVPSTDHRFPNTSGVGWQSQSTEGNEAAPERLGNGINMSSLCKTLARVLVNLDEGGYTEEVQQDTVHQHDVLPDQASASDTREAS